MLDRATGNLRLEPIDVVIGPALTRSDFLKAKAGSRSLTQTANEPWHSWSLQGSSAGITFGVTLFFEGERLYEVHLANTDPSFGTNWMNYSEENEQAKRASHEAWLIGRCCVPPANYPWGTVWSGLLHPRDRLATIVIVYARPE